MESGLFHVRKNSAGQGLYKFADKIKRIVKNMYVLLRV